MQIGDVIFEFDRQVWLGGPLQCLFNSKRVTIVCVGCWLCLGTAIIQIGSFMTPRGRYDIEMYVSAEVESLSSLQSSC